MTHVVPFEHTKRRLDWMDEQSLRADKKRSKKRRQERKANRHTEWENE